MALFRHYIRKWLSVLQSNLTVAFIYNYQNFGKIFYTTIAIIFALLFATRVYLIRILATLNFYRDNNNLCFHHLDITRKYIVLRMKIKGQLRSKWNAMSWSWELSYQSIKWVTDMDWSSLLKSWLKIFPVCEGVRKLLKYFFLQKMTYLQF